MTTAAEQAIARCVERGLLRADCEAMVAESMVGGVYCDGTIVITADGRRCVSRAVIDRVKDARDAQPLPTPIAVDVESSRLPTWVPWTVGAGVAMFAAWMIWRRR